MNGIPNITVVGSDFTDRVHAAWLMTVIVDDPVALQAKLRENKIESNQVHFRNDRYSIFGTRRQDLPNMDWLESRYLVLPLHTQMTVFDVQRICEVIKSGW